MFKPKTIRQTIEPLFVMNFLFGMGVSLKKKPPRLIEYTYTACVLILIGVIGKLTLPYYKEYYIISTYALNQIIFEILIYADLLMICTLAVVNRVNAKNLRMVVALVESNDRTMERMGLPQIYHSLLVYQIKGFVFYGVFTVFFLTVIYTWQFQESTAKSMKFFLTSLSYLPFPVIYISVISFCFWVTCMKLKFCQLNQLLLSMLTTSTSESPLHKRFLKTSNDLENNKFSSFRNVRESNGNTSKMRSVKQIHLEIIKIVKVVNDTFGVQVLLLMTISVIFTTIFLYILYRILSLDLSTNELMRELISIICWLLIYISCVLYVNHVCAKTITEATNMGDLVCKLYESSTDKEFRAEIRNFTLQLIQNPVIFTAYGFFNLDHAFIQGVIGTITTYLVIMIQVGDISKSQTHNNTYVSS
ncbi:hypothetical protein QLX08_001140 [Tetragonisca angustula]|uniref:Gustatory receptor n=1 Tax=Tetragonisca angustula TaxID=166442 RepID=A0AAW1AHI5_9HYME